MELGGGVFGPVRRGWGAQGLGLRFGGSLKISPCTREHTADGSPNHNVQLGNWTCRQIGPEEFYSLSLEKGTGIIPSIQREDRQRL
jgi:hypothetical protein